MQAVAHYRNDDALALDAAIEAHVPLVRRIAYHLLARLPGSVQVDDLTQAGFVGLIEAARKFRTGLGASFETYAGIRIRGAMLDEVRRGGWAPRSVHRRMREVAAAIRDVENETGQDARDVEVAERLGVSLDEYHRMLADASGQKLCSIEDLPVGIESIAEGLFEGIRGPLEEMERDEIVDTIESAIGRLPPRERQVLDLYYGEELTLREIGTRLGVSESRVCQIHGQAILRVRARLVDAGVTHRKCA